MLTTLLFIAIIISCKTFTKGFKKLNARLLNPRLIPFSKTKLNARLTSTTFYDDENGNDKRKKNFNYNYDLGYGSGCLSGYDFNFNNHIREEPKNEEPKNEEPKNEEPKNEEPTKEEPDNYETLYTLIWFDCEDCRQLLTHIKNDGKKILYIDGSYYFFDENDETNTPIFYKNDELIATDVFGIYEELFYNKTIEE